METVSDLQIDLEELYTSHLECSVGYRSCVQVAVWASDGCCPNCQASSPGKLICSGCKASIDVGKPMRHQSCEYLGKGADFFSSFRLL